MKKKISIFGVGRLGLSFGLLLNSRGYDVLGCDVNDKYVESLKDKTFVSNEPGINELLRESTMIFCRETMIAFNYSEIIFVFVQTPSNDAGSYNHKHIEQIISKIEANNITGKTIIIGCTVMPGYCESLQKRLEPLNISVVYNPEFIAQGSIIHGLKNADIVLIGGKVHPILYEIYTNIMSVPPLFKTLSLSGAEIAKISINCFLTLKIAFANMIGEIITNSGQEYNINNILDAIGSDSRIGKKCLSYGFPAGGVCLPRDQKALNYHAYHVGVHTKYTHAIDIENDRHSDYLFSYYTKKNPDKSVPFLFSYISYKKGTDILTRSYQLKLCIELLRAGYKVDVPLSIKEADVPEEFKDYCYNDMVTFGQNPEGYKIN